MMVFAVRYRVSSASACKPNVVSNHSDQGSQYASIAFGERCRKKECPPSIGSVGDAYDKAMAERFFASRECELIDRKSRQTKTESRLAPFARIEAWYIVRRRQGVLIYMSPMNCATKHCEPSPPSGEHGLSTVDVCVASAMPPADNPASVHFERAENLSPQPSTRGCQLHLF